MGSPFSSQVLAHLEPDAIQITGFISLDGSSNVIGYAPTTAGGIVPTNSYTRCKGLQKSLGPAGALLYQPHTSAGLYVFVLDEPWFALLDSGVTSTDQGAVAPLTAYIDANVTNQTANIGFMPGNEVALNTSTVKVTFRNTTGVLTNPVASTGFWLNLTLMRSGIV